MISWARMNIEKPWVFKVRHNQSFHNIPKLLANPDSAPLRCYRHLLIHKCGEQVSSRNKLQHIPRPYADTNVDICICSVIHSYICMVEVFTSNVLVKRRWGQTNVWSDTPCDVFKKLTWWPPAVNSPRNDDSARAKQSTLLTSMCTRLHWRSNQKLQMYVQILTEAPFLAS